MKKIYKNTLLSLCAISVLAGCASKDVEYSGESSVNTNNSQATNGNNDQSKFDNIAGTTQEVVVDNITDMQSDINNINNNDYENKEYNSVDSSINGETITLDSVHFAFDKYKLSTSMREVATANAATIATTIESYGELKIKLEGNCDEWGTDEYNYALGLKRAKATKDALVADGIEADKIMLVSFGESNPICSDKNVKCWKMNRRVDYRLLP